MGREIAYVMGFQGIDWLERLEREKEEKVSTLIKNMKIMPEDIVADIGAGSGYHVFRIAPLAKNGLVYAVDIQTEMLRAIKKIKRSKTIILSGCGHWTPLEKPELVNNALLDFYFR